MKRFFSIWVSLTLCITLQAKVELPAIIGDNMVLQQKQQVALWGKASGKKVTITVPWTRNKKVVTPDSDGRWTTRIETPSAGGPYEIRFNDGEELVIHNVMVGEVWYCGGQSNMEMPMHGFQEQPVENAADFIAEANPGIPIRICKVPNVKALTPQEKGLASWKENSPEEVSSTSAVAYFFARKLYKVLGLPIGIITVDWGGSDIIAWMRRDVLEKDFPGEFDTAVLDTADIKNLKGVHPSIHYNGMVSPLEPFTFKGMIWYQGENNRAHPEQYSRLQPAYVKMMRDRFHNPDAGFYFVQIAPYSYQPQYAELFTSGYFCEAQAKTLSLIPHSGMVTTTDLGSYTTVHPPKKQEVGNRLAYLALVNDYGLKGLNPVAPSYKGMEVDGTDVWIEFNTDVLGIGPMMERLPGFEVAGEDRVFHPATAQVVKGKVRVSCGEVSVPVAVRYCFRNWCEGRLVNAYGIPAGPFRTDDWDDLKK